ncbi:hypothetical protein Tco_1322034 [Tanacetum coccineum]
MDRDTANKIKGKEPDVQPSTSADVKKTRGGPKKTTTEPSYGRIYYKNRVETTSCVVLFIGFLYELCFVPFFTKSGDYIVDQLLLCLSLSAVFCMHTKRSYTKRSFITDTPKDPTTKDPTPKDPTTNSLQTHPTPKDPTTNSLQTHPTPKDPTT